MIYRFLVLRQTLSALVMPSQQSNPRARGGPHSHAGILTLYGRPTFSDSGVRPGLKSQLQRLLAVRSWTNYLMYVKLSFLLCKIQLTNTHKAIYTRPTMVA